MASSSSCAQSKSYVYDVFLSFSGEDTRKTFVDHLYDALDRHGICTFKDDEKLERGKNISDELLQSIEDSRCFIIVFSKCYASSSWCLNELLKIMECHKTGDRITFPVFYDVDPSEVRKQTGAVGEALAIHTNKDESEVENWREALKAAADLSGWDVRNTANGHEAQVIKIIVEEVSLKLSPFDIHVDENLVGMEQRMEALNPSLEIGTDDVRMIGIKGMGGAGKTTLARAIFDKLSITFEGKSFVENVREKAFKFSLEKLQEQVLRDVLKDKDISVQDVHEGKKLMRKRLHSKRVLVVLDDVDREGQLEELAGNPNWFKSGSRIIITTRDEQVLNIYTVKWIHEINLLSKEDAIRLFSRHAFRKNIPTQEHEMQSHEVVRYAHGLPLTIKVLGSFLHGKNESEWSDALARLETIPWKEILEVLKLSYESLEDDYKNIFLDVACFLKDWKEDDAIRMLENYGCHARNALKVLEKKSLLTLNKNGSFIQMHDHLIKLGENIARGEHLDNSGSEATRCIILKVSHGINLKGLENMKKLRCLIVNHEEDRLYYPFEFVNRPWYYFGRLWKHDKVHQYFPNTLRYLYWARYPHWRLPKTFDANNLVTLEMPRSKIKQLWKGEKVMKKLRFLDLSHSKLRRLDLGLTPNLEWLKLNYCYKLIKLEVHGGCLKSLLYLNLSCSGIKELPEEIGQLECLEYLYLWSTEVKHLPDSICMLKHLKTPLDLTLCKHLEKLPEDVGQLESLEILNLEGCSNLREIPNSICMLKHLKTLNLSECKLLEKLPEDVGQLESLEELDLSYCTNLREIPNSICMLKHLKTLNLSGCKLLEKLPEDVGQLESLEELDLSYCTNLREIPNSICMLKHLKTLNLSGCKLLEKLPEDVGQLESLEELDLSYCTNLREIPNSICMLKHLKTLNLSGCKLLEKLPEDVGQLESLEELDLSYCTNLREIPNSICMLKHLKTLNLSGCKLLEKLPEDVGQLESLEELDLSYCTNLREIPNSICMLKHLKTLNLSGCKLLEKLPEDVGQLESLEELDLSYCTNLREIPNSICMLKHLKTLNLSGCKLLEKLPEDVGQLESLEELDLSYCTNLREIPNSICMLKHLKTLNLSGCKLLEKLPEDVGQLEYLEYLHLWGTKVKLLPGSICMLKHLKTLNLSWCYDLEKLPEDVGQLESLEILYLHDCTNLREIPNSICMLKHLKTLNLYGCKCLEKLPEDVGQLESLEELDLEYCSNLREIPISICNLKCLKKLDLGYCVRVEKLPEEVGNLRCLQELYVRGSGITDLPQSISLLEGLKIDRDYYSK